MVGRPGETSSPSGGRGGSVPLGGGGWNAGETGKSRRRGLRRGTARAATGEVQGSEAKMGAGSAEAEAARSDGATAPLDAEQGIGRGGGAGVARSRGKEGKQVQGQEEEDGDLNFGGWPADATNLEEAALTALGLQPAASWRR
uniref:Uncharacterized protein n=1 Tax=Oryza brachyantha TaxID=4533 RepID=J3M7C7_ORYBR